MKNRYPFLLPFQILILLVCSYFPAAALDYKVPPKPDYGISDNAKLFDRHDIHVLDSFFVQNSAKNALESYVLTIADTSWKDIDTISKMVAASWGIGDADRGMLLIMSSHWAPRFKIILGEKLKQQFNDTMIAFLETKKLPDVNRKSDRLHVITFFFRCIRKDMFTYNIGEEAYDMSSDEEKDDKTKLEIEYAQYRSEYSSVKHKATISDGVILSFLLFSVTVVCAYLIIWYRDYRANSI